MSRKGKRDRRRVKPSPELKAIWDKVPEMEDCKGMCQSSCGPIPAYTPERKLIEDRTGKELKTTGDLTCSMLTAAGACSVYGIRPLICRLWGTVDHPAMRCPHGCKPKRWLTHEESMELFAELEALTGDEDGKKAAEKMLARLSPAERTTFEVKGRQVAKDA
jgi:Fe-S-cluster containining protein